MIVDMPREAKVGGGVWHEYILLLTAALPVQHRWHDLNSHSMLAEVLRGSEGFGSSWQWHFWSLVTSKFSEAPSHCGIALAATC